MRFCIFRAGLNVFFFFFPPVPEPLSSWKSFPPTFVAPSTGRMAVYLQNNLLKNLLRTIASDLDVLPSKVCADLEVTHLLVIEMGFTECS